MKRIVECLLEEGIDESMIHRVLDLIEEEYEVVNEVSINRWKQAAQNSIRGREINREVNDDEFTFFDKGLLSRDKKQGFYDNWQKTSNYNNDRVNRARYLADNLPNSNKSASKLMKVAKKSAESRDKKAEKYGEKIDKQKPKVVAYLKSGNPELIDKAADKRNGIVKNYEITKERADHAKMIANKPMRDENGKEGTGNYYLNSKPYSKANKERKESMNKAEREMDKAVFKYEENKTQNNKEQRDRAIHNFKNARNDYNSHISHHKL